MLIDDVVFSELCKVQPNFRDKIVTVVGDAGLQNLGISKKDLEILENEVDIIFHAAATVNFLEKLDVSARINVGGTLEILKLAKRCKHLSSIVYVSTAYSNCHLTEVEEKFYDPPLTAEELFDLIDKYGEKLDENEKLIIGKWPNNYCFTKAIAEHSIQIGAKELPICIVRPAIITATYKEPLKSWIDNYYGAIGAVANIYNGLIKTFHCNPEVLGDVVPADLVVNGIIAAAYGNYSKRNENLNIYNFTSSHENPLTFRDWCELSIFYGYNFPTIHSVWFPNSILTNNAYVHLFYTFFLHIIPAFITDLYLVVTGRSPRAISIYKKIYKFNENVSFFATRDWIFSNSKARKLWRDLSPIDQKIFNFNFAPKYLNWNEYLSTLCAGLRVYLFKDNWESIEESRKKLKRLYYCHVCIKSIFDLILILTGYGTLRFIFEFCSKK
ncbi:hypothetical protein WA026_011049 [Henosepilachna vigintioctopunctata]|uniref:Fatty acyl-CoA reductase n=1 Tax=Henosepilachna vigintioctopunctata TaxID=420089 RepID=A0AAW1U084_9CUCU